MPPNDRIAHLTAENRALRKQDQAQRDLIQKLQAHLSLALTHVRKLETQPARDSHKCGKSPSCAGLAHKGKSLRKKSDEKPEVYPGDVPYTYGPLDESPEPNRERPARYFAVDVKHPDVQRLLRTVAENQIIIDQMRLRPDPLHLDHYRTLRAYIKQVHETRQISCAVIYQEMQRNFEIRRIREIRDLE
jgi:hypothetical protein